MLKEGKLTIEITQDTNAWKLGGWYKGMVGERFDVMMYSINADEYTVYYKGEYKILPGKDVKEIK